MKFLRLIISTIIFLFLTGGTNLLAQIKQISEEEVNTQKIFIDATREKIMSNYENAATLFKEVLKRDKNNDAAAYELARIYDFLDQKDKALQFIKMATEIDPENEWYQMFLAGTYEETGNVKGAIKIFEGLKKKNPKDAFFYERLAFLYVKAQQPEKGIKIYNEMERAFGVHEDLSKRKHRIYLGMGNKKKAAGEFEKLIQYYPSNTDYYHMLASFHTQMGDKAKADEVYRSILKIDPADVKASIALAEKNKSGGDDLGYIATLQPLFEKDDVNIDLKIKELIPYINEVAKGKASPELTEAILSLAETLERVHPKEAKSFSAYGDLLYYSGDKTKALLKYQQALQLNKSIFSVWEQVMYIKMETREFESLLSFSEDAIDRFPNQAKAYYFNGLAFGQLKKHRDAINSLKQSLLMSRKNPMLQVDIHNHLATEYFQLGQFEKAYLSFDKALKINPNNPFVLNRYSQYLAMRNENLEKAKSMSAQANEIAPNQATFQDTYGWILYRMKEYKAAKDWISKAMSNGGDNNPNILEHYGDVLFQLKDIEGAIDYWQRALNKGSNSSKLEKKIADKMLYE